MRAIAVQCAPGQSKSDNIAQIEAALDGIAAGGDTIVSLPEMWTCLGGSRDRKLAESETLPASGSSAGAGPAFRFLAETARRLGVTLHGGSIGERDGEMLFNTTLVFGPDGAERARYRKIHLFDATTPSGAGYRESSLFGAGSEVVTCDALGASGPRLGLSICYDLRFPELFAALRSAGADIILVPSAFTVETGRAHWEVLLRARAIETQCWIMAAATVGTHFDGHGRPRETYGHSLIIDPWGDIRASGGEHPGLVQATLDMTTLARVREAIPVHAHRRLS